MQALWQKHHLSNMDDLLVHAAKNKYAILHINVINFDWAKTALMAASKTNSPIIIAVTEKSLKNMFGFETFAQTMFGMVKYLEIKTPVVIHLDHGSYEGAKKALAAGFSSVMFDGSHLPFEENYAKTKEIVALAKKTNASVEAEIGSIGGKEDDTEGHGAYASVEECVKMSQLGISCLAAGIGNIHGLYPANWKGLNFDLLNEINKQTKGLPLVLHGGTGIPAEMIQKAISMGVAKLNVATETLTSFTKALGVYFANKEHEQGHGYDPRKYFPIGFEAVEQKIVEKLEFAGSKNKA